MDISINGPDLLRQDASYQDQNSCRGFAALLNHLDEGLSEAQRQRRQAMFPDNPVTAATPAVSAATLSARWAAMAHHPVGAQPQSRWMVHRQHDLEMMPIPTLPAPP